MDPREQLILSDVRRHGWHVVRVMAGEGEPASAYSVGLFRTFSHPELILNGLPLRTMHGVLERLVDAIRAGTRFAPDGFSDEALEGCRCAFREVPPGHYALHLAYALWFHGGPGFPALQCVWPDRNGLYPWQPGFDRALASRQSVLADRR